VTDRPPPSAAAHRRTRRDHASETAEDYVEAIAELGGETHACRVRDLADRFGVSHVTVVRVVRRLERDGLVTTEPYRPVTLTDAGIRLAAACRERHEIVYRFLLAIGVDERIAAIESEGIEHHVSRETLERFRAIAESAGD
jgi:DtxR family manganese transport transcriptional regulator